jgi:eukaryotic-like serine/threonine-protein kinase
MINQTVHHLGGYRLIRRLGSGGFADVYLAEHLHLKTLAAIKVLRAHLAPQDIDRFLLEARTIAHLNHPHIVRVFDFRMDGTTPFLVMEYAPEGTLRQAHPRGSIVPLASVVSYVKQVAAALQHAHTAKLIHRDVKPENMLLRSRDEVLLSDFGIAAVAHSASSLKTQDQCGTPQYMAPEQIQGKPRPASDQYALGVVVYEWLCGRPPFQGEPMQVLYQQTATPPPPLRDTVSAISPAVERVVLRALAKDPRQRFESIEAFAIALEQAAQPPRREATLCTHRDHGSEVLALAWSPDGARVASIDASAIAMVWDARTGETLSFFNWLGPRPIRAMAWSFDGKYIAIGDDCHSIEVRNAATGECRLRRHTPGKVGDVIWSPDRKRIAAGSIGEVYGKHQEYIVQVWNGQTGDDLFENHLFIARDLREEGKGLFHLARNGVVSIRWLPDSRRMAFVRLDLVVEVWDTTTRQLLSAQSYKDGTDKVHTVAWSPNGKNVAAIMLDQAIEVWDATTCGILCTYRDHTERVRHLTWSPDSQFLASYSADGTMHVWNAAKGTLRFTYDGLAVGAGVFAWSPEGKRIAFVNGDHRIRVLRLE